MLTDGYAKRRTNEHTIKIIILINQIVIGGLKAGMTGLQGESSPQLDQLTLKLTLSFIVQILTLFITLLVPKEKIQPKS